ncbi:class I SAM-dependent methyltransferase [Roseomonas aerophila]|uniref:Class I SAM-dependent methyltransferase n=1 Tax=Teichococcus aerophilus TaxID=1224513 RepID=A0ABR7RH51_9PROT|nr:cyclopropane-fatty-acyl-phospholipid synthase family protein [Pseudoroseomonas aerophila]MBC9205648.1 class I SAM-dependent methyltransferase [Pseudoroseomonas aerophila]
MSSPSNVESHGLPLPRAGLQIAAMRRLMGRLRVGTLNVVLPDGSMLRHRAAGTGPEATLVLHQWRAVLRLLLAGDIGFAEAYLDGQWSSPDLTALIELVAVNRDAIPGTDRAVLPVRLLHRMLHRLHDNTLSGSRRNIMRHYDLGNAFYEKWLDEGMSYSAAPFADAMASLETAQSAKQDRVLELMDIQPGQRVLEIGFGWGGLAERLAARGCHVTGLTVSPSQHAYATARLADAGLASQVDLRLQDYRKAAGKFDRIVSIEMVEAVGEAWWPTYFDALRERLTPGGTIVLQSITIAEDRFEGYRRGTDFIQRHIFPGGMLPSPTALQEQVSRAGLMVREVETFGLGYAQTLRHWQERFQSSWPQIEAMGFCPRFRRMWEYYLSYCEAGFRARAIDVGLWKLGHAG